MIWASVGFASVLVLASVVLAPSMAALASSVVPVLALSALALAAAAAASVGVLAVLIGETCHCSAPAQASPLHM